MATVVRDVYTHSGIAPMPITINSLFANEMGFRLSFEILNDDDDVIYSASLSPNNVGDMDIDLLPVLKYYVSPHEFNHVGGIADASSEVFKYKYRTTESYIPSSIATEWYFLQPYASQNKTVLEFTAGHHFTGADIGKYITVNVSDTYPDGSAQQNIAGNWILTDIVDGFQIAISLPFSSIGSGVGLDANVYLADQTRTTLASTTSSYKYLYNYELSYYQKMNCDTEDNNLLSFLTTSGSVKLLSSHIYPASRDLYPWQNEYVTILDPNTYVNKIRFTSDNCILEKTIGIFPYKSVKISNIFEDEYTLISGNLPLIDCNTRSYQVDFLDGAGDVIPIDYLDNCATLFEIGNYDCIDGIENIDNEITIDINVPAGTIITVPQPFIISLDGTTYSQSVEVTNETIFNLNIHTKIVGEYMETITFKNGWKMECRCVCATIIHNDDVVFEWDDEWDVNVAVASEGGSIPPPVVRPWKTRNLTNDITFSVDGPYIQISLDGVNYSDTVIVPPSMTSGNLYIMVNDISGTHIDTLVISSDDMNTVTYPIQSEVIKTTITLSPNTITFVDVEESQPSQKIEVTFTKNNNNAITTFTVTGNYLISNTIDGVYSSSITSNLQNGNIYVKMDDTNTLGIFTGTITATSLSGIDTASLSGEVVAMPVYEAKVVIGGSTMGTSNQQSALMTIGDINDLNSTQLHRISPIDSSEFIVSSVIRVNNLWFSYGPYTNRLYASSDAITWTKASISLNYQILGIYYINNQYVMYVSTLSTNHNKFVSLDGITWTSSNIHNDVLRMCTYNEGKIVLVFSNTIRISIDNGDTWVSKAVPVTITNNIGTVITTGDTIYIILGTGNKLYKSIDNGDTWGNITATSSLNGIKLLPNGQCVVMSSGRIYVTNSTTSNTSWTNVVIENGNWLDINTNGTSIILTGRYVNTTNTVNTIARTTDLTATTGWVVTTDKDTYNWVLSTSVGSNYIIRTNSTVMKSSDGLTWDNYTLPSNYIITGGMWSKPIASI